MEVSTTIYCILRIIAGVFGILFNLSCLWYFITSCNKGLCNHLIILLGVLSTIICSGNIGLVVSYHSEDLTCERFTNINEGACRKPLKKLLLILPNSLYAFTGVITGVLSVIRSISIIFPFYMIKKTAVYAFILMFSTTYVMFFFFTACKKMIYLGTGIYVLIVFVVALTGFPSIYILIKKSHQKIGTIGGRNEAQENITVRNHRRASFTIFILTVVCIITNGIAFPAQVLAHATCSNEQNSSDSRVNYYSKISTASFLINCICNPAVLIARKREIRLFLIAKVRKVMSLISSLTH